MKRYVIGALTSMTILTISCSGDNSSEQLLVESSRHPMTFTVSQEPITRLNRVETVDDLQGFYLLAQVETNTSGRTQSDYYFSCEFTRDRQSSALIPMVNQPPTWPGKSSQKVSFYAMSEYQSSFMGHFYEWGGVLQNDTVMVSQYTFNADVDLLAAYNSLSERESKGGEVPLHFRHIKSELQVNVKGMSDDWEYTLEYVSISGQMNKMYNFVTNEYSDPEELDNDFEHYYYIGSTTTSKIIGSQDYDDLSDGANEPPCIFVFPGKYDIELSYWAGQIGFNPIHYTKKATIELTETGKKYIINLTLPDA